MSFRFFDPDPAAPAAVLGEHVCAAYQDIAALDKFVEGLDVVTFEFENVPAAIAQRLAQRVPVYPPPAALHVTQDRLSEKRALQTHGLPVARHAPLDIADDVPAALQCVGLPAVFKTRRLGYDGKGQLAVSSQPEGVVAFQELGGRDIIAEQRLLFQRELSLVSVRGVDGHIAHYPLVENRHSAGILRETLAPAPSVDRVQAGAQAGAERLLTALNYVGCLAIEFFQVDGELIANEIAPRVHNTGHWTIEGATTSQFENHLRAICGLPLGDTAPVAPARMLNVLGDFPDLARLVGRCQRACA